MVVKSLRFRVIGFILIWLISLPTLENPLVAAAIAHFVFPENPPLRLTILQEKLLQIPKFRQRFGVKIRGISW